MDHEDRVIGDLRVRIRRDTCIGMAACIDFAPYGMALDDEGIVTFLPGISALDREAILDTCRSCPVDALEVFEVDGGDMLVP